jgi:NAD(P)-dependent dehydrogenase (short-subunit alcohol dehydrogenase family)
VTIKQGLIGKVAVVLGGSQGIGYRVAFQLAMEGAHVCILARNKTALQKVLQDIQDHGGQASTYSVDAISREDLDLVFQKIKQSHSGVDIFIHLVGGFTKFMALEEIAEKEWHDVLQLNVTSAFLATQTIEPILNDSARLVYIGSIAGLGPNPHAKSYMPYGVAKAGLATMVKYLAKDFGHRKITVNMVSPGTTATERVRQLRGDEALEELANRNPLNHVLQPEDCAAAILFFVSPQAQGITGINLNVNAGSVM